MKSKSFHKKLTASYIYLLAAVAAIMLLGFVLTVWFSVLPSMRITMQSKTNELSNRLDEQCSYLMTCLLYTSMAQRSSPSQFCLYEMPRSSKSLFIRPLSALYMDSQS